MKFFFALFLLTPVSIFPQLVVTEIGALPESVSNNAQCEGFLNGVPFIYTFGGIDSTKTSQGIHLRSYRYNTQNNTVLQLPDLPDTLGKIAAGASRIGDTIYIAGGYHVFPSGNELSSNKLHRFDITSNSYMTDGAAIPQATDDHVQVIWRDSLLILITGWKNTGNIANTQIYNPSSNTWAVGTPVPNNHTYKSFGASGTIVGDTIYYFGGARSTFGFSIQNAVRKGVINPSDPTQIDWSFEVIDSEVVGYRMAATRVGASLHWLGGSNVTYNYDGIAYNGSGGVPPSNRDLYTLPNLSVWQSDIVNELPMDLRGLADVNDSLKYLAGGMLDNQTVTNKVYKLEWSLDFLNSQLISRIDPFEVYPNPFSNRIEVNTNGVTGPLTVYLYDISGRLVHSEEINGNSVLSADHIESGAFIIIIKDSNSHLFSKKMMKLD